MKKILIFLIIAALSVSMLFVGIGCKETTEPAEEVTEEEVTEEEAAEEETPAEEAAEEEPVKELSGELKVMSYWPGSPVLPDLADRFMEVYPDVEVKIITEFQDMDYVTAVTTSLQTDERPDVFQFNPQYGKLVNMLAMDGLAPIDDIIEETNYSELAPQAYEFGKLGTDHSWNLVWQFGSTMLWYSLGALEAAGVEELPQTWEELLDACAKVESTGIVPIIYSGSGSSNWTSSQFLIPLLLASLGEPETAKLFNGELSWTDEKVREALQNINDLTQYVDEEASSVTYADISLMLGNGDGAMHVMGSWITEDLKAMEMEPFVDYDGTLIPPVNSEIEPVLYTAGSGFCLTNNAPNVEAAKEWLRYCTTPEWQEYMVNNTGTNTAGLLEGFNYEDIHTQELYERYKEVKKVNILETHVSVLTDFYNLMSSKILGNISDDDFLSQMDDIIQESEAAFAE